MSPSVSRSVSRSLFPKRLGKLNFHAPIRENILLLAQLNDYLSSDPESLGRDFWDAHGENVKSVVGLNKEISFSCLDRYFF